MSRAVRKIVIDVLLKPIINIRVTFQVMGRGTLYVQHQACTYIITVLVASLKLHASSLHSFQGFIININRVTLDGSDFNQFYLRLTR